MYGKNERVTIPQKIIRVLKHYSECYVKRARCLHCNDCIAYALISSEALNVELPSRGVPYSVSQGHAWNFVKFLGSTIAKEYLPCDRALAYETVKDFAFALLRLPVEARRHLRCSLLAHAEFTEPEYTDGVHVCR
jgi:hypothetical protein